MPHGAEHQSAVGQSLTKTWKGKPEESGWPAERTANATPVHIGHCGAALREQTSRVFRATAALDSRSTATWSRFHSALGISEARISENQSEYGQFRRDSGPALLKYEERRSDDIFNPVADEPGVPEKGAPLIFQEASLLFISEGLAPTFLAPPVQSASQSLTILACKRPPTTTHSRARDRSAQQDPGLKKILERILEQDI